MKVKLEESSSNSTEGRTSVVTFSFSIAFIVLTVLNCYTVTSSYFPIISIFCPLLIIPQRGLESHVSLLSPWGNVYRPNLVQYLQITTATVSSWIYHLCHELRKYFWYTSPCLCLHLIPSPSSEMFPSFVWGNI